MLVTGNALYRRNGIDGENQRADAPAAASGVPMLNNGYSRLGI